MKYSINQMYDTNDLNVQFFPQVLFHIIPEGKIVHEEQKAVIKLLFE